jgi:hypothetical protein
MISEIKLIFDMDNRTWVANGSITSPVFIDVQVGFESAVKPTTFNNLSFGVTLTRLDENIRESHNFPKPGIVYVSTDQDWIEQIRFECVHNTGYTLSVWCKENDVLSENSWTFKTPELIVEPYPDYEVQ